MEIYRIVHEKYADGLYASGRPGRWNEADQFVLYGSASRALATLELIVHQANIRGDASFKVLIIDIPDTYERIGEADLPSNWRRLSAYAELQSKGSTWYRGMKSPILSVPSAVIPKENNFLINTRHPDYQASVKLKDVEDYFWDERV